MERAPWYDEEEYADTHAKRVSAFLAKVSARTTRALKGSGA